MNLPLSPTRFQRLLAADAQNVSRDPTMLFVILVAVLSPIGFAIWQGPINETIRSGTGLAGFTRYAALVIVAMPAFLVGWVTGFLLLEDRDESTLFAIDVTPMGKSGYFAYRVSVTGLISWVIAFGGIRLLLPDAGLLMAAFAGILIAMEAVCVAVGLPAIARNKVEGLALNKLINIAALAPFLVFIPSPLRLLGGVVPTYWIGELIGSPPVALLPMAANVTSALAVHAIVVAWLFRVAINRIG